MVKHQAIDNFRKRINEKRCIADRVRFAHEGSKTDDFGSYAIDVPELRHTDDDTDFDLYLAVAKLKPHLDSDEWPIVSVNHANARLKSGIQRVCPDDQFLRAYEPVRAV